MENMCMSSFRTWVETAPEAGLSEDAAAKCPDSVKVPRRLDWWQISYLKASTFTIQDLPSFAILECYGLTHR